MTEDPGRLRIDLPDFIHRMSDKGLRELLKAAKLNDSDWAEISDLVLDEILKRRATDCIHRMSDKGLRQLLAANFSDWHWGEISDLVLDEILKRRDAR